MHQTSNYQMTLEHIENLGFGGFSIVDRVRDQNGNEYARKTFKINQGEDFPDEMIPKCLERFKREAGFLESIQHKNIVKILGKDLSAKPPYYLMPVADSILKKDLETDKTLAGNRINLLMDVISCLEEIHSIGTYHRDLKPGNILSFTDNDGYKYFAVSDFGLMRDNISTNTTLTTSQMSKGNDMYTAPEIANDIRSASACSDIYSVGCLIHEMYGLENRKPFVQIKETGNFATVMKICTNVNPLNRYDNVSDLRDAILSIHGVVGDEKPQDERVNSILEKEAELDDTEAKFLAKFIDSNKDEEEGKLCLARLNNSHIEQIIHHSLPLWNILAENYCDWIKGKNGGFNFALCDGFGNRLIRFYELGNINVKAECLLAMLLLGTTHNRFYVERKVVKLLGHDMDENLARRIAIEFMADKSIFCKVISDLGYSIDFNTNNLHPKIQEAIKNICT